MDSREFLDLARYCVVQYLKEQGEDTASIDDTFIVWSCKTLRNNKALIGTDMDADYYEVTYCGERNELYLDVYNKIDHVFIPLNENSDDPKRPDDNNGIVTGVAK